MSKVVFIIGILEVYKDFARELKLSDIKSKIILLKLTIDEAAGKGLKVTRGKIC